MNKLYNYDNYIKNKFFSQQFAEAIGKTVEVISEHVRKFDFKSHKVVLLCGDVQSGKTSHMFGVLADAADYDFEFFIVLTASITDLQQQTFQRALSFLDATFSVCGENDDMRFIQNNMRKPVVIVLKKNSRVLESWKNHLASSDFPKGRSVFIIDDEADAASLNTKVNKESEVSAISQKIDDIKHLFNSSFYLQVTATPQSLILQADNTGYKPEFGHYFEPGEGYLGGDFFYKAKDEQKLPASIKFTKENELSDLLDSAAHIPEGMQEAIFSFLIAAAHIRTEDKNSICNFLIHPSVKIDAHEKAAEKIKTALNDSLRSMKDDDVFLNNLQEAWNDLKSSKLNILDFDSCCRYISKILENGEIKIITMNSQSKSDFGSKGVNIIVGGNSLGRGVTFPKLQTTYYCRKSKRPQADTAWQHCRAFGYDRDPDLVRMFLPPTLFKLFVELNDSNNAMLDCFRKNGFAGLKLQYPRGIKPTRANVIQKDKLRILAGGVNYFANYSKNNTLQDLEILLKNYGEEPQSHHVDIGLILKILKHCSSDSRDNWEAQLFIDCINSLNEEYKRKAILIVRRGRDIKYGSGTLLSPNDRKLGDKFPDMVTLTMYRIKGNKGWKGDIVWIPNIKLPEKHFYYVTD